ncbi:MAG: hypothetical protein KAH32_05615 [Chlamydiia bacterium]|nr:hypothetical protein [Chlamydiia bacterium]
MNKSYSCFSGVDSYEGARDDFDPISQLRNSLSFTNDSNKEPMCGSSIVEPFTATELNKSKAFSMGAHDICSSVGIREMDASTDSIVMKNS